MKNFFAEFGRSLMATLFFAVILCGVYPLVVFGAARLFFPHQAAGSPLIAATEDTSQRRSISELLDQATDGAVALVVAAAAVKVTVT